MQCGAILTIQNVCRKAVASCSVRFQFIWWKSCEQYDFKIKSSGTPINGKFEYFFAIYISISLKSTINSRLIRGWNRLLWQPFWGKTTISASSIWYRSLFGISWTKPWSYIYIYIYSYILHILRSSGDDVKNIWCKFRALCNPLRFRHDRYQYTYKHPHKPSIFRVAKHPHRNKNCYD